MRHFIENETNCDTVSLGKDTGSALGKEMLQGTNVLIYYLPNNLCSILRAFRGAELAFTTDDLVNLRKLVLFLSSLIYVKYHLMTFFAGTVC